MRRDWTRAEVDAIVEDYFDMFLAELRGEPYVKAEHRRRLSVRLEARSDSAIENKHQNISAALIDLGMPYIPGYKPYRNYQGLLLQRVAAFLERSPEIERIVASEVDRPAQLPEIDEILAALVSPPERREVKKYEWRERFDARSTVGARVDYLAREAVNQSVGLAGELFGLRFEQARLIAAGKDKLSDRVEHVARTQGDGAGFDIRSYETNGKDRFIEVKTTRYGRETPFYISRNELGFSQRWSESFQLYRVFDLRITPRLFQIPGPVDRACSLEPIEYVARF